MTIHPDTFNQIDTLFDSHYNSVTGERLTELFTRKLMTDKYMFTIPDDGGMKKLSSDEIRAITKIYKAREIARLIGLAVGVALDIITIRLFKPFSGIGGIGSFKF